MKKEKTKRRLKDLIPDDDIREEIESGLYSGKRWLGPDGLFTGLLQSFVDAALEGEMDHHLKEERDSGIKNRRNGRGQKKVWLVALVYMSKP